MKKWKKVAGCMMLAVFGAVLLSGSHRVKAADEGMQYATEASAQNLADPYEKTDHAAFENHGYIGMKPSEGVGTLTFTVEVTTPGAYEIAVTYTAKEGSAARKMAIYANDEAEKKEISLICAADWDTFMEYKTTLQLAAGSNEIVIASPADYDNDTVKTPNVYALSYRCTEVPAEQFMDCFEPMPIIGELSADCWGAPEVGPRDQSNGLEDAALAEYSYWDGGIIKEEETGIYYMFASRWNQAGGHWGQDGISGWQGSQAIYATSDNLYGPYTDQGPLWPDWCEGAGHNVFPFALSEQDSLYADGYRYAISISDTGMHGETANGTIHIAKSLEGPWELIENENGGRITIAEGKEFSLSNISIMVRPDGMYEAINRNGDIIVTDSLSSEWELKESGLWKKISGMSSDNVEDPVIWYADGLYHIVVNKWDARMAYYLTSEDGLTGWIRHPGTAYTPTTSFLSYTDGTENNWTKLERPNVYIEDGRIVAMTFAVIDVQKEEDFGNDAHGSKVIVVPFSADKLTAFDVLENPLDNRTGLIASADTTIQTWGDEVAKNYGAEQFIQLQKDTNYVSHNMGALGEGTRPDEWYDNKIGYLKFDLSDLNLAENEGAESAYLSLVYMNRPSGDAASEQIQVVLADPAWSEGTGNESNNSNRAESADITWERQAALIYDAGNEAETMAVSESFSTTELEQEVLIDVTALVNQFILEHPGETEISFALNVTETGTRIRVGSREAGETFAPKLTVTKTTIEREVTPTPEAAEPTEEVAPEVTNTPMPEPTQSVSVTEQEQSSPTVLYVIIAILSILVVGLTAALVVVLKKKK